MLWNTLYRKHWFPNEGSIVDLLGDESVFKCRPLLLMDPRWDLGVGEPLLNLLKEYSNLSDLSSLNFSSSLVSEDSVWVVTDLSF